MRLFQIVYLIKVPLIKILHEISYNYQIMHNLAQIPPLHNQTRLPSSSHLSFAVILLPLSILTAGLPHLSEINETDGIFAVISQHIF